MTELDISKNLAQDKAIELLAEALKSNLYLTSLSLDENKLSLIGFEALQTGLKMNKILYDLPPPENDINKLIQTARDRELARETLGEIMESISQILKENQPKLTSVRGIGVSFDQNAKCRESMEVFGNFFKL